MSATDLVIEVRPTSLGRPVWRNIGAAEWDSGFARCVSLMSMLLVLAFSLVLTVQDAVRFPTVTSKNLEGRPMTLPADFAGERNVVFVAFKREQQDMVDTWLPFVKTVVARTPDTDFYEIPTIGPLIRLLQWTINRGMRGGIPDVEARKRTVTLYLDKAPFRKSLGITTEETIHVLVVDRAGHVSWRETGPFTEAKGAALADALARTAPQATEPPAR